MSRANRFIAATGISAGAICICIDLARYPLAWGLILHTLVIVICARVLIRGGEV